MFRKFNALQFCNSNFSRSLSSLISRVSTTHAKHVAKPLNYRRSACWYISRLWMLQKRKKRRIRERARRAVQTAERREADLQQRRRRLAGETDEVRQARLQRMTDRLADETAEEREARLQQTTASNYARLAAETAEEREARLQSDRLRHRQQQVMQAQLPLFQQSSVRTKMRKFHAHMAFHNTSLLHVSNTSSTSLLPLQIHNSREGSPHNALHLPSLYTTIDSPF